MPSETSSVRFVNGIRVENDIVDSNSLKSACMARYVSTTPAHARARESDAVLERRALACLADDQAMQSFIRWRTGHGAVVADSLREELGVQAYVDAIFQRVPA